MAPPPRLLADRGRITRQSLVCILMSRGRLEQNVFSWQQKAVVDRSSFTSVGKLFHADFLCCL